ncbi:hypothetical protein CW360_01615 [Pseudomonas fluvialis]|uniref:Uncharacterized protein n=1 Tax=Pseudomonas fluvialis TaxID=1793966 RepID=A0A2I0CUI8_9PSED|nr:hypothetical protein [Pseudomonas pharmacofabricae]PKF73185.1 hypothetical protein CW360_01615 [Pseudomonas pharmacofabricae]
MIQLNKILKTFTKTIDQLEQLTTTNNIEASRNTERIDRLQKKNLILIAEAQAAKVTAEPMAMAMAMAMKVPRFPRGAQARKERLLEAELQRLARSVLGQVPS